MKLCFSTLGCWDRSLDSILALAKENGMDAVEIRGIDGKMLLGEHPGFTPENIAAVKEKFPHCELIAVGTNSIATANMIKAGAEAAATGENAVIVNARRADVIVGPIGIVIADALLGEVTPAMAQAVGQSGAVRILLPSDKCETYIAGTGGCTMSALIEDAMCKLAEVLN